MRASLVAVAVLVILALAPGIAQAQAPRAAITQAPPAETESPDATFAFQATGFALLSRFECSLDGAAFKPCTSPVTYTGLVGGTHEFAVRFVGALTDTTPARHTWTVLTRTIIEPPPQTPPRPPDPPGPRPGKRRDANRCAYGANRVGEVAARRIEAAIACLVDRVRTQRGLARLRRVSSLAVAAQRHARDMVRRRYFAHASLEGRRVVDRARASGYLLRRQGWTLGEVLAWGVGARATPAGTVKAWLQSRPHRQALLHRGFRDIGVGLARGVPIGGRRDGGTFAAVLGRR